MDFDFVLPQLSPWHKKKYLAYATQVLQAQQQMTSPKGKNIVHYTLRRKRRHLQMDHYPKDDRMDLNTGAQYFYHCHRENFTTTEHGHFHCFLRYKNIPKTIKPAAIPERDKYMHNPMAHVIAIGMNQHGFPIRLFTVNRWVTTETWYDGHHVPAFIKRFKMDLADDPYWQILDKWVEGMIHLFAPQITWLHQARDRQIAALKASQSTDSDYNIYLDHAIEELSEIDIDLQRQVEWIIATS